MSVESIGRWAKSHGAELAVAAAVLGWILACANKNKTPPAPTTVPAQAATVTYKQIGSESWSSEYGTDQEAAEQAEFAGLPSPASSKGTANAGTVDQFRRISEAWAAQDFAKAAALAHELMQATGLSQEAERKAVGWALVSSGMAGDAAGVEKAAPQATALLATGEFADADKLLLHVQLHNAYALVGKHEEAKRASVQHRAFAEAQLGKDSKEALESRRQLAIDMRETKDLKGSRAEFESLLAVSQALGSSGEFVGLVHVGLGMTLLDMRKPKDARSAFEAARAQYAAASVNEPARMAWIFHGLGRAHLGTKDKAQARTALETADVLISKASRADAGLSMKKLKAANDAALAKVR